jgi:hypothetical protein
VLRGGDGFEEGCDGADTDGTETEGADIGLTHKVFQVHQQIS